METLLRRLLRCFGTRHHRHRKGRPRHRHHDSRPRGGTGTDGARRSFCRPARFRRGAGADVERHETPAPRRRRWLRLRGMMNRVLARSASAPCGTTIRRAVEPWPAEDAAAVQAPGAGTGSQEFSSTSRERAAAATVSIQAHFRGHLARQALRALRSLVKLQAFARGAYVRKQANIAIRCMNVLVRLQVRARSRQQLQLHASKGGEEQQ